MRSSWVCFHVLLAASAIAPHTVRAEERPGLIIYTEPPITSLSVAESIHFTAFRRKNVAYSDVVLTNGQKREIQNGGILAFFDFPPADPRPDSFSKLGLLEQQAKSIIGKYPTVRYSVEAVTEKWRAARQEAAKRPTVATSRPAPASPSMGLTVGGFTYSGVSLESVEGGTAKVFHSEGIANIPLGSLTPPQIALLNSTSASVRIDPDWSEKLKHAELEKTRRIEEAARKAVELAALKREALITRSRQMEEAARYEDALTGFLEAGSELDIKRVASSMAKDFEVRKDYESAAEYFEKAGLFSEAGRIRRTYNIAESVSSRLSSEEIFRKCAPATVSIVTGTRRGVGVGSGFFVKKGGYILTNYHVVENARALAVVVNKETFDAQVIAHTKTPDLALIKIELEDHPVLEFADSDKVKPGAQAYAIGTPNGLPKSITGGMISATDRTKFGNEVFQMSVLINHGNSGGPVLNENGKVVGISTFGEGTAAVVDGVSIGSDIQGINYAIKANEVKALMSRIPRQ